MFPAGGPVHMTAISYGEVLRERQQLYDTYLSEGRLTPFIWPWDTLPAVYLFVAIYLSPLLSRRRALIWNGVTMILVVSHSSYIMLHRRCLSMASGYLGGLMLTLSAIMTCVLLLLHDPTKDFARLEWRDHTTKKAKESPPSPINESIKEEQSLRRRKQNSRNSRRPHQDLMPQPTHKLVWQTMPLDPRHRLDWALDLMSSLRGPNWNFRIPTLPPLTAPPVPTDSIQLSSSLQTTSSTVHEAAYDSPAAQNFRFQAVVRTVVLYMLIDVVKVVMISDSYFLGLVELDAPCSWRIIPMIHAQTGLPVSFLTRFLRLFVSLVGVLNALTLIFSLSSTLIYTTLPQIINPRALTYCPILDLRFFATLAAPPFPAISDAGLAGFWGRYWHQMFRFGITEPSKAAIRFLNIPSRSTRARAIQLLIAFGLTGLLHMAASYTCISLVPSKPLLPLLFFLSQAAGIMLQTAASDLIFKTFKLEVPALLCQITNSLFALAWLYLTGPLLADDFARCGIWLFEPIPISFIRGFQGQDWWTWTDIKVQWWTGLSGHTTPVWDQGIGIF